MAIDSKEKRKAAAAGSIASAPVVTPEAFGSSEWRGQAAGLYAFFFGVVLPSAVIDSISPEQSVEGDPVTFLGTGTPGQNPIASYDWWSSIDSFISTSEDIIGYTLLSSGSHTIRYRAVDDQGNPGPYTEWPNPIIVLSGGAAPWLYVQNNQVVI